MEGYLVKLGKGVMGGGKKRWCKIIPGDPNSLTNKANFFVYKDLGAPAPKNSFLLAASKISEEENPRDKKYVGRAFFVEGQGKRITLAAESRKELDQWLNALTQAKSPNAFATRPFDEVSLGGSSLSGSPTLPAPVTNGGGWQKARPRSGQHDAEAAAARSAAGTLNGNGERSRASTSMRLQQLEEQERRLRDAINTKEEERKRRDSEYSLTESSSKSMLETRGKLEAETEALRHEMEQLLHEQEAIAREEAEQRARDQALDQALDQARRNLGSQSGSKIGSEAAAGGDVPSMSEDERMLQERLQRARNRQNSGAPVPSTTSNTNEQAASQVAAEPVTNGVEKDAAAGGNEDRLRTRQRTRSIQMAPRALSAVERDRAISMALRSLDEMTAESSERKETPSELIEGLRSSTRQLESSADENPIFFTDPHARERDSLQIEKALLAERPQQISPPKKSSNAPPIIIEPPRSPRDGALSDKWAQEREEEKRREAEEARALEAQQREWLRTRSGTANASGSAPPQGDKPRVKSGDLADPAAAARAMREEELRKAEKQARKAKIQAEWDELKQREEEHRRFEAEMAQNRLRQEKEIAELKNTLAEQRKMLEKLQFEDSKLKGGVATCCTVM